MPFFTESDDNLERREDFERDDRLERLEVVEFLERREATLRDVLSWSAID